VGNAAEEQDELLEHCPNCSATYDVTGFDQGKTFQCQLCDDEVVIGQMQSSKLKVSKGPGSSSKRRGGSSSSSSRSRRSSSRGRGKRKRTKKKKTPKNKRKDGKSGNDPSTYDESGPDESTEDSGDRSDGTKEEDSDATPSPAGGGTGTEAASDDRAAARPSSGGRSASAPGSTAAGPSSGGGRRGGRSNHSGNAENVAATDQKDEDNTTLPIIIGSVSLLLLILIVYLLLAGDGSPPSKAGEPGTGAGPGDTSASAEADATDAAGSAGSETGLGRDVEPPTEDETASGPADSPGASEEGDASSDSTQNASREGTETARESSSGAGSTSSSGDESDGEASTDQASTGPADEQGTTWDVDEEVKSEILRRFEGASGMSTSELRRNRRELIEAYSPRTLIPAAIQSMFDTTSGWKADQANKILMDVTGWQGAPKTWKPLKPADLDNNAQVWKQYWLSLDWEAFQSRRAQEKSLRKKMEELRPLCRKAASALPSENEGTRKTRKKGEAYLPAVIELLKGQNADREVSKGANKILQNLTGQDFGPLPGGDRSEFIQKWTDWWQKNRDEFSYD